MDFGSCDHHANRPLSVQREVVHQTCACVSLSRAGDMDSIEPPGGSTTCHWSGSGVLGVIGGGGASVGTLLVRQHYSLARGSRHRAGNPIHEPSGLFDNGDGGCILRCQKEVHAACVNTHLCAVAHRHPRRTKASVSRKSRCNNHRRFQEAQQVPGGTATGSGSCLLLVPEVYCSSPVSLRWC